MISQIFLSYPGHLEIVNLLLEMGANPNIQVPQTGRTPIHAAVETGKFFDLSKYNFRSEKRAFKPDDRNIQTKIRN